MKQFYRYFLFQWLQWGLVAAEGRVLYETLGWKLSVPCASAVIPGN